jgi:RNA polymerase sigma-70 factor (ECF subfamily)
MFLAAQRGDVGPVGPAPSAPQESHQRIRQACWEAIRLARAVATHPACAHPDADALAALLLFHGARLTGRLDDAGEIVPLPGQARDRWDAGMLRLGLHHLRRAQRTARLSRWHLQAGIAAEHALAPSYAATDWPAIVRHYDALLRIDASASPSLGHAIALVESGQARSGLDRLMALLPDVPSALKAHTLAAVSQAEHRLGLFDEAQQHLQQAVLVAPRPADARMLARRLTLLQTPVATGPEPADDGTLRRAPGR